MTIFRSRWALAIQVLPPCAKFHSRIIGHPACNIQGPAGRPRRVTGCQHGRLQQRKEQRRRAAAARRHRARGLYHPACRLLVRRRIVAAAKHLRPRKSRPRYPSPEQSSESAPRSPAGSRPAILCGDQHFGVDGNRQRTKRRRQRLGERTGAELAETQDFCRKCAQHGRDAFERVGGSRRQQRQCAVARSAADFRPASPRSKLCPLA